MAKLEIKKNPFSAVRCLHPRSIYNKYINDYVTVGCGHCDACRMAASDRRTSMLNFVKEISVSAFFGTLSFDEEHLPVMSFDNRGFDIALDDDFNDVFGTYFVKSVQVDRNGTKENVYASEKVMDLDLDTLSEREASMIRYGMCYTNKDENVPFCFGYLRKKDLQNFFKRLRKHLNKVFDGSIYYYAVGEYGPQTLRPHFHFLLFANEVLSHQTLLDCVTRSWSRGNVDLQSIQTNASSYVAGYLSNYANLPSFLRKKEVAPFFIQSHFKTFSKVLPTEKFREWYFSHAHKRVVESPSGCSFVSLPQSFVRLYYPKCTNFSKLDLHGLYERYATFARGTVKVLINSLASPTSVRFSEVHVDQLSKLCSTLLGTIDGRKVFLVDPTYYSNYLWYKRVHSICAEFCLSPRAAIDNIYDWWRDEDHYRLIDSYKMLESLKSNGFLISLINNNDLFHYLSVNTPFKELPDYIQHSFSLQGLDKSLYDYLGNCKINFRNFADNPSYQQYVQQVNKLMYDRTKTKGVNDYLFKF